jgi:predicted transcriptional regulator
MSVQRRLKVILSKQGIERDTQLREFAKELGCSLSGTYGGDGSKHLEDEVIRRIREAARSIREARLWWIALISATASALSALAAWCAVLSKW